MAESLGLFDGIGGWPTSVGLELDADACATRAAIGLPTVRADVASYPAERFAGRVEGVCASPPCQTFSRAGKREGHDAMASIEEAIAAGRWDWRAQGLDDRTGLVLEVGRWVETVQPRWVTLEQVREVLPLWEAYAQRWRAKGWQVWTGLLGSEEYGVPQSRTRAVLMAHRDRPVARPPATHQRYNPRRPDEGDLLLPRWVAMQDVLDIGAEDLVGFPRRDDKGDSPNGYRERDWRQGRQPSFGATEKVRSWTVRTRRGQTPDGRTQERDSSAPALTAKAPGQWALRQEPTLRSKGGLRGQDRPAQTLTFGHNVNGWRWVNGGWERPITMSEALTIQGFPPDLPVAGTKTSQARQIGNAIPPPMASAVVEVLAS